MKQRDVHLRVLQEVHPRAEGGGGIGPSLQAEIDGLLRFLRRTRYPAVASTQVGIRRPIVAIDLSRSGQSPVVLVDPVLESVSCETAVDTEGCLTLPDLLVPVKRPVRVTVRALARTGQRVRLEAGGLLARIIQHKLDHLEGTLLLDHLPGPARSEASERLRRSWPRCRRIPPVGPVADGPESTPLLGSQRVTPTHRAKRRPSRKPSPRRA